MNKIIDLNEPVYEIYMKYPEILDILLLMCKTTSN